MTNFCSKQHCQKVTAKKKQKHKIKNKRKNNEQRKRYFYVNMFMLQSYGIEINSNALRELSAVLLYVQCFASLEEENGNFLYGK